MLLLQVRPVPLDPEAEESSEDMDYIGAGAQLKLSMDMRSSNNRQADRSNGNALP